ncbi:hypothetical protein JOM56_009828 [Amanita muscaria]
MGSSHIRFVHCTRRNKKTFTAGSYAVVTCNISFSPLDPPYSRSILSHYCSVLLQFYRGIIFSPIYVVILIGNQTLSSRSVHNCIYVRKNKANK